MKEVFKSGKVAQMLGVTQKTVRNYVEEDAFAPYLSPESRRIGVKQSMFYHDDIIVLNTLMNLRGNGHSINSAAEKLSEGYRDTTLPVQAAFISSYSAADVYKLREERDSLIAQLDKMRDEVKELNKEHMDARMTDQRLIGRLEAKVEQLESQLKKLIDKP